MSELLERVAGTVDKSLLPKKTVNGINNNLLFSKPANSERQT